MNILQELWENGKRANWEPITDEGGAQDHRGRKWPVCQCYCRACFIASLVFLTP